MGIFNTKTDADRGKIDNGIPKHHKSGNRKESLKTIGAKEGVKSSRQRSALSKARSKGMQMGSSYFSGTDVVQNIKASDGTMWEAVISPDGHTVWTQH